MTSRIARLSRLRSPGVSCCLIVMMAAAPVVPLEASGVAPAQGGSQTGPARAENTQVVVNGAVVNVSYDLVAPDAESTFVVVLEASQNEGKSYDLKLTAVTGDVGSGIRPGPGKRIVWEAAKDTDSLQLAQFRYRVALKPLTSPQASAAAGSGVKPASQPLSQSQKPVTPALPQQPRAAGGGNSMRWPGLGLIGGGGALSALAAAGPLRKDPYDCDCDLKLNKPLVGAGIGMAAAGALLMMLGGGGGAQSISVTALPKGVSVGKTIRFDWPQRNRD